MFYHIKIAWQMFFLPYISWVLDQSIFSASTNNVAGMLLGRFLLGTGLGVGPPVASLYITEVKKCCFLQIVRYMNTSLWTHSDKQMQVSPAFVRGTYGSFIQIATCCGLMGALLIGIPVKNISGW